MRWAHPIAFFIYRLTCKTRGTLPDTRLSKFNTGLTHKKTYNDYLYKNKH